MQPSTPHWEIGRLTSSFGVCLAECAEGEVNLSRRRSKQGRGAASDAGVRGAEPCAGHRTARSMGPFREATERMVRPALCAGSLDGSRKCHVRYAYYSFRSRTGADSPSFQWGRSFDDSAWFSQHFDAPPGHFDEHLPSFRKTHQYSETGSRLRPSPALGHEDTKVQCIDVELAQVVQTTRSGEPK